MGETTSTRFSHHREIIAFCNCPTTGSHPEVCSTAPTTDTPTAEDKAPIGNLETENQMPFNNQCICPLFLPHGFHARLVRRGLFADSLEDLQGGISPGIAVRKTLGTV